MTPPTMCGQHQAVEKTPNDKVQAGTVPETANKHGDQKIHVDARYLNARTSERNVDVVHQPGGKGDVPMTPKFSDISLKVWPVEIFRHFDAEQPRRAYGNIRIGGK